MKHELRSWRKKRIDVMRLAGVNNYFLFSRSISSVRLLSPLFYIITEARMIATGDPLFSTGKLRWNLRAPSPLSISLSSFFVRVRLIFIRMLSLFHIAMNT